MNCVLNNTAEGEISHLGLARHNQDKDKAIRGKARWGMGFARGLE